MPEGDTIYQTAAALRPLLVGQPILAAKARTPGPAIHRVVGARVTSIEPLGKHMLIRFDNGLALHTHLRMGGTWHRYAPGERWKMPAWRARVVLEVPEHVVVCFNAPVAELMEDRAVELHPALLSLGPDLARNVFDSDEAFRRLRARPDLEIAEALLDQRVMAGIGNVFKCEALWWLRLDPWLPPAQLDDGRLGELYATARKFMRANRTGFGRRFPYGDAAVHGRAGRPCRRCSTLLEARAQGEQARTTYYCGACQKGPEGTPPPS